MSADEYRANVERFAYFRVEEFSDDVANLVRQPANHTIWRGDNKYEACSVESNAAVICARQCRLPADFFVPEPNQRPRTILRRVAAARRRGRAEAVAAR